MKFKKKKILDKKYPVCLEGDTLGELLKSIQEVYDTYGDSEFNYDGYDFYGDITVFTFEEESDEEFALRVKTKEAKLQAFKTKELTELKRLKEKYEN